MKNANMIEKWIKEYLYIYQTPPHEQDVTQGLFF